MVGRVPDAGAVRRPVVVEVVAEQLVERQRGAQPLQVAIEGQPRASRRGAGQRGPFRGRLLAVQTLARDFVDQGPAAAVRQRSGAVAATRRGEAGQVACLEIGGDVDQCVQAEGVHAVSVVPKCDPRL